MSSWRLILRSLIHHRRSHFAVALGVMAATAVLTGALLVGDSMRASLMHLALDRLGRIDEVLLSDRFFRQRLSEELDLGDYFQDALPAILLRATLENPENNLRASDVTTLSCDERFWSLGNHDLPKDARPGDGQVVLNEPLARELGAESGDEVLLRVSRVSGISADSPLGRKSDAVRSRRLTVTAVIAAEGLGRFSLRSSQRPPRNAFVSTATLQAMLDRPDKVNAILVAGKLTDKTPPEVASRALHQALRPTLDDYGLSIEHVRREHEGRPVIEYYSLTSDRMVLPPAVEKAARAAFADDGAQPAFTYLANYITAGDGKAKIPYSTVTAIDSNKALGPLLTMEGKPLKLGEDEIALNRWAADDLAAQGVRPRPGDKVELTFFEPETTHGSEKETTHPFRLKTIVKLASPQERPELTNDPDLTPEVQGFTDQASIANWDPPFHYESDRVRTRAPNDQDEQYWDDYKTTPKAFVSLATGQRLWKSRFGWVTSIRIPPGRQVDGPALAEKLRSQIKPASLGFAFRPVKRLSLEAAHGTTPFSILFLGFSMFIIAAAVMLVALLFRLGIEQRAGEVGILLALGLRRRKTGRLLAVEGAVVAALGGAMGLAAGVGYAWLMLAGLRSWWMDAVATPFLHLDVTRLSLAIGYASGVLVSLLTIVFSIRQMHGVSVHRLVSGQATEAIDPYRRHGRLAGRIAGLMFVVAVGAAGWGTQLGGMPQAGAFFGCGVSVLTATLLLVWIRLRSGGGMTATPQAFSLARLAARNAGRNPSRSTLTIGLVASASFLIVAISAFRIDPSEEGAGGFDLVAESDQPIYHDLGTKQGRAARGITGEDARRLAQSTVISLRVKDGDDASCLNLYDPQQPRVLGVTPAIVQYVDASEGPRFTWAASAAETDEEKANPWRLLEKEAEPSDTAVPVVLDKNTAMYSLHKYKGVGETIVVPDDRRGEIQFRIVGLLSDSILQGSLLISESRFRQLYPDVSGYRYFLIKSAAEETQAVSSLLENELGDEGLDATLTSERLRSLLAVQNTYLSTFQSLGALGLLLGTLGLATVQLRNVVERRGELALMRAAGFRHRKLVQMVMLENALLLLAGLATGVVAALLAVLPHWLIGGAEVPLGSLAAMLAVVLLVGLVSGMVAVRRELTAPLLSALRGD